MALEILGATSKGYGISVEKLIPLSFDNSDKIGSLTLEQYEFYKVTFDGHEQFYYTTYDDGPTQCMNNGEIEIGNYVVGVEFE